MSFQLPARGVTIARRSHRLGPDASRQTRWPGVAFLVEAMVITLFITFAIAVFTQVFMASVERAQQAEQLSSAVALASGAAERFVADPHAVPDSLTADGLHAVCKVTSAPRDGGVMHYLTVQVYSVRDGSGGAPGVDGAGWLVDGLPVYTLGTSAYESGEVARG